MRANEFIPENEIRGILGLPIKTMVFKLKNKELGGVKTDQPSGRLSKWIEYGLPYTAKNGRRYFKLNDLETFLQNRYGITIEDFKKAFRQMQNDNTGGGISAIHTD